MRKKKKIQLTGDKILKMSNENVMNEKRCEQAYQYGYTKYHLIILFINKNVAERMKKKVFFLKKKNELC